jgi:hypothetical protein
MAIHNISVPPRSSGVAGSIMAFIMVASTGSMVVASTAAAFMVAVAVVTDGTVMRLPAS